MNSNFIRLGLLGLALGLSLSFIGFGSYDEVRRMFLFEDLRLLFTFGGAVLISAVVFLIAGVPRLTTPFNQNLIWGGLLFGAGWALSGACPAIVLVQLGEGLWPAIFTLLGMFGGVYLHQRLRRRFTHWAAGSCDS
jgi:uncharacterized membrane protein YedE/YeeE